jgi:hypothetical protein
MFCQACGQQLDQYATFCARCGAPIGTGKTAAPSQLPPVQYAHPPTGQPFPVAAPFGQPLGYSDKSKVVAGVLQLVLGGFGAGRFYTGHIGIAFAQIAVTWLTCGFGALWPFIDGIMMLVGKVPDAQGRPLRD